MTEISVRRLADSEWQQFRAIRLRALQESPEAFVASFADEEAEPEQFWRDRLDRSDRLIAQRGDQAVGVVSVGGMGEDRPAASQLFGLWVEPEARGTGVASALVAAGAARAAEKGHTHLYYWVGTDNGRAVAFASGFGFRPTADRRPMRVVSEDDGAEEVAMVLPLGGDRGWLS